jgi:hypothetical protein
LAEDTRKKTATTSRKQTSSKQTSSKQTSSKQTSSKQKAKSSSSARRKQATGVDSQTYRWLILLAFVILVYWSYTSRNADSQSTGGATASATPPVTATTAGAQPTTAAAVPTPSASGTVSLTVVGWNIESGGSDVEAVADRIASFDGVDLWGLTEVESPAVAAILEVAAEQGENANFEHIVSRSGRSDRMAILYDADRFERTGQDELEYINLGGSLRAPLLVNLRDRWSGQEFIFMVNHLFRGNDSDFQRRLDQAAMLNEWAIITPTPAIAVGDYNFDWDLRNGDTNHDQGYDFMTADDEWVWVRPAQLATTQCSGWPCRYNSVLDFVFVANGAREWTARSEIVIAPNDFPDNDTTPDHRPVIAWFDLPVVRN